MKGFGKKIKEEFGKKKRRKIVRSKTIFSHKVYDLRFGHVIITKIIMSEQIMVLTKAVLSIEKGIEMNGEKETIAFTI